MFSTHKNRLVIEQDANMLANRISMLQQEEEKIMKKINQTRKRADEIMKAKQRNDEMFKQQEEANRKKYFDDRVQRQVNKEASFKAVKKVKKEDFKMGKRMTMENDNYKKEFLNEVWKGNKDKKDRVKEEEEMRLQRLRQIEEEKKRENQEHYYER